MSNLIPFQFESHEIRTVNADGGVLVVAKDVLKALGYAIDGGIAKYIAAVPDEWKGGKPISTPRGTQEMAVLSEQGLYFFLARSDKPKALPFQMWIAGEVLPSIRRTGSYNAKPRAGVSELRQVTPEFKAALSLAKAFGFRGNQAVLSANNTVRKLYGTDCAKLIDATHLIAEDQEPLLTPTDIGTRLDGRSAVAVNKLLAEIGFQLEQRDLHGRLCWELTETGKQHAVYLDTGKKRGDGTPVRQIRWLASVLNLIQPKAA